MIRISMGTNKGIMEGRHGPPRGRYGQRKRENPDCEEGD